MPNITAPVMIQVHRNWSETDCYGKPIIPEGSTAPINKVVENDHIELIWPDGHIQKTRVFVETTQEEVMDMGHTIPVFTHTAYVSINVHGQKVRIDLNKTKIKVRKLKT